MTESKMTNKSYLALLKEDLQWLNRRKNCNFNQMHIRSILEDKIAKVARSEGSEPFYGTEVSPLVEWLIEQEACYQGLTIMRILQNLEELQQWQSRVERESWKIDGIEDDLISVTTKINEIRDKISALK